MRVLRYLSALFVLCAAGPALAQVDPDAQVGRVSIVSGAVAFYGSGDSDWSAATVNMPVATGAWLATDRNSRAELHVGSDSIDMAYDTQLNAVALQNHFSQL